MSRAMPESKQPTGGRAPQVGIWCDGCYDMVHFGHANSLRQAKLFGDRLVIGVHTDADIAIHKGPPVFTLEERCKMLNALKWVDEVVAGAPYVTTLETLDRHGCDFCCHGDDVTLTSDGVDTYHEIKASGRYKEVRRTAGISTTGLLDRILARRNSRKSPWTGADFLLTTEKIAWFSRGTPPGDGDKVVYVAGGFDLFHVGHVNFLEKARALGDYLVVGVYSDEEVGRCMGDNYPVMRLQERLLSVLSCKYVSEAVLAAPYSVRKDLMDHLKVDVVVHGNFPIMDDKNGSDPYKYPRELNKFISVDSGSDMTTEKVVERIVGNRSQFQARNARKEQKELDLIDQMAAET